MVTFELKVDGKTDVYIYMRCRLRRLYICDADSLCSYTCMYFTKEKPHA